MKVWNAIRLMVYINKQGGYLQARRPRFGKDSYVTHCDNEEHVIFTLNGKEDLSVTGSADELKNDWQIQVINPKRIDGKSTLLGYYEIDKKFKSNTEFMSKHLVFVETLGGEIKYIKHGERK